MTNAKHDHRGSAPLHCLVGRILSFLTRPFGLVYHYRANEYVVFNDYGWDYYRKLPSGIWCICGGCAGYNKEMLEYEKDMIAIYNRGENVYPPNVKDNPAGRKP